MTFVLPLTLGETASRAAGLDPEEESPFTIGRESCGDYLTDIARDPSVESLYDAWLAGYVKIAAEEWPSLADVELVGARNWLKTYCRQRVSDTFLTATVRYLESKEHIRFGLNAEPVGPSGPATRAD